MPMDFPSSPVVGQVYNGYTWTGVAWEAGYSPVVPNLQLATYATAAARDAAITSPTTGMQAYLLDVKQTTVYDGSSWKSDMAGLVPMVPTTISVSGGAATANSLGTITFSAVTGLRLNNVFTSTYKNYRIVTNIIGASTGLSVLGRLSANSVDLATAVYQRITVVGTSANSVSSVGSLNQTSFNITTGVSNANNLGGSTLDITNPATASRKVAFGVVSGYFGSNYEVAVVNSAIMDASAYDGLYLFPNTGNVTGSVTVYGYNS